MNEITRPSGSGGRVVTYVQSSTQVRPKLESRLGEDRQDYMHE